MARRKKTTRRAPTRRATTRRATTRRRRASNNNHGVKNVAAAVLGGAGGAVVGGLLVRSGVAPTTAAVGVTIAGGVAATMAKKGTAMRLATGGAAAAGAGQLALAWLANQATKSDQPRQAKITVKTAGGKKRQAAYAHDVEAAFDRAREQLAMEDEAAAMADDFDDEEVFEAA